MRLLQGFALSWAALGFVGGAHGYHIDRDSCKTQEQYDTVKGMITSVYEMVDQIRDAVNAEPMDEYTANLLMWLFGMGPTAGRQLMLTAFDRNAMGDELYGLDAFRDENTRFANLNRNEVIIYCDTKRLTRSIRSPLHLRDTKVDEAITKSDGCAAGTLAWTWKYTKRFNSIQLCPGFLKRAVKYRTANSSDLTKPILTRVREYFQGFITGRTNVDMIHTFDMTVLHEMMHTKQGGSKIDVGGTLGAYGWKNCRAHSAGVDAIMNADCYALFAVALRSGSLGSPIGEDGNFVPQ